MRFDRGLWLFLLAIAALIAPCSASVFSKDKDNDKIKVKGEPLPEWGVQAARTQTPAYAKDDPAVVLFDEYLETVDDQGRAVEREREAIRILKPQGRHQTCAVGYDVDEKINYFNVWTIAADEKRYQAKEGDFTTQGGGGDPIMQFTYKVREAHPPAVDVGAVVICESEETLQPYIHETDWHIQADIPIVFQALEVDLPPGRAHAEAWHKYAGVKPVEVSPNHWRWEVKDMPALLLRDIPSPPDWSALVARMTVQWGDAAVGGKDNQWRAIGEWFDQLEAHRPDPTPELTAKALEITQGVSGYYEKLARVTGYVQRNIRYFVVERGIGGLQAHPAGDIYRNRYGDCKDKTTLLISMLQVAGIQAFYVPVDHRRGFVDPEFPSLSGDHMITAIEIPDAVQDPRLKAVVKAKNGKRYLIFDPTDERTPVGNLPSNEQGGYGLLVIGPSSQVIALPVLEPDASGAELKGEFALATNGTLTGTVQTTRMGAEGGRTRLYLKRDDEKELHDNLEQSLGGDIPGVSLVGFKYDEPEALDKPVTLHYELSANQYAHQAGSLLLVRPRVVGSDVIPNNDKPRTVPIDLSATGHWHDSYDITLPDGYVVDDMPDPVNLDTDFASYHSSISAKDKVLHYERDYKVKQLELPAEKQPEFLKFEGRVMADEKSTVVLKKMVPPQATVASGSKQ